MGGATRTSGARLTAAAAELDAGPDQHDVPEKTVAVRLAPEHLPAVEMTSECQGCRMAEKLGFERRVNRLSVLHGPMSLIELC